jgi:mannose-6-phosphate isomerase-like protein (cupin superfamily)
MFIHEDDRRSLVEMQSGTFRTCKVVIAKKDCTLGNHSHAKKDEQFLLVAGTAYNVKIGDDEWKYVYAPYEWFVPMGAFHSFDLAEGSIMVGTATREFDPEDENGDTS